MSSYNESLPQLYELWSGYEKRDRQTDKYRQIDRYRQTDSSKLIALYLVTGQLIKGIRNSKYCLSTYKAK